MKKMMVLLAGLGLGACVAEDAVETDEAVAELGTTFTVGTVTGGSASAVSYDATSAYFTYLAPEFCSGGLEIQKMNLTSGAKTTLLTGGCSSPGQSASDGTNLYYAGLGATDILRKDASAPAAPVVTIADAPSVLFGTGIVVDAARVYWADGGNIASRAKAGGAVTLHFVGNSPARVLAVDATSIYFETPSPSFTRELRKIPIAGGASTVLHIQGSFHSPFALQGSTLYWSDRSSSTATISRMSSAGGAVTALYTAASTCVLGMAVNASNLYWSEIATCDQIPGGARIKQRNNPTGAGGVTLAKAGLVGPSDLALTATNLFWIDGPQSARTVRRAPLP